MLVLIHLIASIILACEQTACEAIKIIPPVYNCTSRAQDNCDGPCTSFFARHPYFVNNTYSMRGENHPNSTSMYEEIQLNSTYVNDQLFALNLSLPYDEKPFVDAGDYWFDYEYYDVNRSTPTNNTAARAYKCNHYTNILAHDIAVNGTGYISDIILDPDDIEERWPGKNITQISLFVTFNTEITINLLSALHDYMLPPFVPGLYLLMNETSPGMYDVRLIGGLSGLLVATTADGTMLIVPRCYERKCEQDNFPKLVYYFVDMTVPNVTRDMVNNDADFVTHALKFEQGTFFRDAEYNGTYEDYGTIVTSTCGSLKYFVGIVVDPPPTDKCNGGQDGQNNNTNGFPTCSRSKSGKSRSRSRSKSRRSRSRSTSKRSRSRSKSRRSRSRSTSKQSRSLSTSKRSHSKSIQSRSRSKSQRSMSRSNSGSKSRSRSKSKSMSHSQSQSQSASQSISDSNSNSHSMSDSRSRSRSQSNSKSNSHSNSNSHSASRSNSNSHSDSYSQSKSQSNSNSNSMSKSNSKSNSLSHSGSQSNSDSTSKSMSHSQRRSQSGSQSMSNSNSNSHSNSNSRSDSYSQSRSQSTSQSNSDSGSYSNTKSDSQSNSHSDSNSNSASHSNTASGSNSGNMGLSQSKSHTHSETVHNSRSRSRSRSRSISRSPSQSKSGSNSHMSLSLTNSVQSRSHSISKKSRSVSKSESTERVFTRFFTKNSFAYNTVPLDASIYEGANTGIRMRMGDGIDETGMLGALPTVFTFYSKGVSKGIINYHTDGQYNTTKRTDLYNSTICHHFFRFVVYPCYSKCPARFTHRVLNETAFSAVSHMKGKQISHAVENATRDSDVFILDYINSTFVIFNDTYVPMTQFLNFSSGNFWGGFIFGVSFYGAWTDPAASKYVAVLPTTNYTSDLYISMRLSFNRIRFNGTAVGLLFVMDDEFPFNTTTRPGTFTPVAAFSMCVDNFLLYPIVRNTSTSTLNLDTTSDACARYNPFDLDMCTKYKTVHSFIDMHVTFNTTHGQFFRMQAIVPPTSAPPYIQTTADYGIDSADENLDVTAKIGRATWRLEPCLQIFADPVIVAPPTPPTDDNNGTPIGVGVVIGVSLGMITIMGCCFIFFILTRQRRRPKKKTT